jgi:hypothetical protein
MGESLNLVSGAGSWAPPAGVGAIVSMGTGGGAGPFETADSCAALPDMTKDRIRTNKASLTQACWIISELDGENPEMFPRNAEAEGWRESERASSPPTDYSAKRAGLPARLMARRRAGPSRPTNRSAPAAGTDRRAVPSSRTAGPSAGMLTTQRPSVWQRAGP